MTLKDKFNGKEEHRTAPRAPTPHQIWHESERRELACANGTCQPGRFGVTSNVRSIFWELPYWKVKVANIKHDVYKHLCCIVICVFCRYNVCLPVCAQVLLVRHLFDPMHILKNVSSEIMDHVMGVKDGVATRKDLEAAGCKRLNGG